MKNLFKNLIKNILIFLIIIFPLGGCNQSKVVEYPLIDKNPVKLIFTFWGSQNEIFEIENMCAKFSEKYPWISVEAIHIPGGDYNAKIAVMTAGNGSPDIGYMNFDLGENWANEGRFINLYDMVDKDEEIRREDFINNAWYEITPNNAWGIRTAGECFGLFYNKNLLESVGIKTLPTTADEAMEWDEFVELAQKLTIDKNGYNAAHPDFDANNIKQYGFMFESWEGVLSCFIYSNGGSWFSKDDKSFALDQPQSIEAIQRLADLINVYHVAPSPITARSLPSLHIALQSELVAMVVGGQWINLDLGKSKTNYDIGVLPKMERSLTVSLSGATVIHKSSRHVDEAWLLFKWMINPENAIELYSNGLWMPILKEWYRDPGLVAKWVDANPLSHPAGFKEAMMNQFINNSVSLETYYVKNSAKIIPKIISGLDPVWVGKKSAEEAIKEIKANVQPSLSKR
ncbi:MAG: sugar ABC transporter substrate-binding protein [Clostridiaceae bacterium]|nr:sugar ABC transporter substrate-binding protein [Clostridiaceae bacterium]